MFAVTERDGMRVAYPNWDEWRIDRRAAATREPAPIVASNTSFCAACWGQGRIWTAARNGEGLIPVRCAACDGECVVPNPAAGSARR